MEPSDIYEKLNTIKDVLENELNSNPKTENNQAIGLAIHLIEKLMEEI